MRSVTLPLLLISFQLSAGSVDAQSLRDAIASVTAHGVTLASDDSSSRRGLTSAAPAGSTWPDVLEIEPGEAIVLTVRGSTPVRRYLIAADGAGLTVLDVADDRLSWRMRNLLIGAASDPDRFGAVQQGRTVMLHKDPDLRLTPQGVSLAGELIVPFDRMVSHVARGDVASIDVLERAFGRGMGVGALIAGVAGVLMQRSYCRDHSCDSQGALRPLFFTGVGVGLGAGFGSAFKVRTHIYGQ